MLAGVRSPDEKLADWRRLGPSMCVLGVECAGFGPAGLRGAARCSARVVALEAGAVSQSIYSLRLLLGDSLSLVPSPYSVLARLGESEACELLLLKEWVRWWAAAMGERSRMISSKVVPGKAMAAETAVDRSLPLGAAKARFSVETTGVVLWSGNQSVSLGQSLLERASR